MGNQDWSRIGDDIIDAVQSAIEDGDFANLSHVLNDSANLAMDKFQEALMGSSNYHQHYSSKPGSGSIGAKAERDASFTEYTMPEGGRSSSSYGGINHYNSGTRNSSYNRTQTNRQGNAYRATQKIFSSVLSPFQKYADRFASPAALSILGYVGAIGGGIFTGIFGISEIALLASMIFFGPVAGDAAIVMILLPFLAGSIFACVKGIQRLSLAKKFKKLVEYIGDKEYCEIEDLTLATTTPKRSLLKDIKKMISKNWFKQGHLDDKEQNLILTNAMFKQYLQTARNNRRRQLEEQSKNVAKKFEGVGGKDGINLSQQAAASYGNTGSYTSVSARSNAGGPSAGGPVTKEAPVDNLPSELPEDVKIVIREGRSYLAKIKASNDAIPEEEISNKISRLERIIDQIFERVETYPELVDDLRRFMKYYLPTTVKLLKAYEELDRQEVQGPNILKSKADIEESLDTINQAFENLLDGFFATSAVDIASDISVMQTLMSQEGLLNQGLGQNQPNNNDQLKTQ